MFKKGPDLETGARIFPVSPGSGLSPASPSMVAVNSHIDQPELWLLNLVDALIKAMIGLLQRVSRAAVAVDGETIGEIGRGLLVLVAVHRDDEERDITRLAERILGYRVFPDAEDRMNRSLLDDDLGLLLVPQFTLAADTKKGSRPSFSRASGPEKAERYFQRLVQECRERIPVVETGQFGANMQVTLTNDGPVTFWLES